MSLAVSGNQQGAALAGSLLSQLRSDLTHPELSSQRQQALLEQLKVLGRNPANSNAIFAKDGIATLSQYAFDVQSLQVAREASRCLANAMLLSEKSRQTFLDLGYVDKAARRLENDDRDDEFLLSRIIFLLTYGTTVDLTKLVLEQGVAKSICRNIAVHARRLDSTSKRGTHPMDQMALVESLKLLFNITAKKPELAINFTDCVPDLFSILTHIKLPSSPLQPPISSTVNALMNLDIPETCSSEANTQGLVVILERSITSYPESELDQQAMPLLTLLRRYYAAASPSVKEAMQKQLLPSDEARSEPLGKDDTLPSQLLRFSVSPTLLSLRDNISTLLFELSDSDAAKFIHNIGYGYASGFLATHKIEVPQSAMAASGTSAPDAEDINPVTGQRRAAEPEDNLPEMTQDEKEREAERLYVLFERLRATGVVDVQNPVHQAMQEGRFEEVDDSDS